MIVATISEKVDKSDTESVNEQGIPVPAYSVVSEPPVSDACFEKLQRYLITNLLSRQVVQEGDECLGAHCPDRLVYRCARCAYPRRGHHCRRLPAEPDSRSSHDHRRDRNECEFKLLFFLFALPVTSRESHGYLALNVAAEQTARTFQSQARGKWRLD